MINQQMWTYIGWVLFTLFVVTIIVLAYALYRDYELTKNKKTALPSLNIVETTEKKNVFVSDDATSPNDIAGNTNKIPSRRALRGAKAGTTPSAPAVAATPSAFFDDDEEFTLTEGQD
jgi:hypothetical protein